MMRLESQKLAQICAPNNTKAVSAVLLAVFLIMLTGSVQADGRSAAPSSVIQRKPPFNGSIFGKRSMWPTNLDNLVGYGSINQVDASQLDALNSLVQQQQDALVRTLINRCYNMQQAQASETELALCANFLSAASSLPRKSLQDGSNWFGQLVSICA